MHAVKTYDILFHSLQVATRRLGDAVVRLRALVGAERPAEFYATLLATRSLRMECRVLRAELGRHRAERFRLAPCLIAATAAAPRTDRYSECTSANSPPDRHPNSAQSPY